MKTESADCKTCIYEDECVNKNTFEDGDCLQFEPTTPAKEEPKARKAPRIVILSYSQTIWRMKVQIGNTRYNYTGISPFFRDKIERLVYRKAYGKALQILRKFEFEKEVIGIPERS